MKNIRPSAPRTIRWLTVLVVAGLSTSVSAQNSENTLLEANQQEVRAELIFKDAGQSLPVLESRNKDDGLLVITGTYSSPEGKVEGLVINKGTVVRSGVYPWDGLLTVNPSGKISLANVSEVDVAGNRLNLRANKSDRKAFFKHAGAAKLSAIQSHLLVTEGQVDVKQRDDAKEFRRRIIIEDFQGRISVFDSTPQRITLYEAARISKEMYGARFAINLDMGTYDFCFRKLPGKEGSSCGLISDTSKLTNLLKFSFK